eukprot:Skav217500  [mRNA]  locus=scaffold1908:219493:220344:- [translate_table: standard]
MWLNRGGSLVDARTAGTSAKPGLRLGDLAANDSLDDVPPPGRESVALQACHQLCLRKPAFFRAQLVARHRRLYRCAGAVAEAWNLTRPVLRPDLVQFEDSATSRPKRRPSPPKPHGPDLHQGDCPDKAPGRCTGGRGPENFTRTSLRELNFHELPVARFRGAALATAQKFSSRQS